MKNTIAFVNYNTTELSNALIGSIRKSQKKHFDIIVFDNSDKTPFVTEYKDVRIIDNTKAQVIDVASLAYQAAKETNTTDEFNFCSVKHALSIQRLIEILHDEGLQGVFICDSDILLKRDLDDFTKFAWLRHRVAAVGRVQKQKGFKPRLLPFLCYLNLDLIFRLGIKYALPREVNPIKHKADTGAYFLKQVFAHNASIGIVPIDEYFEHYHNGSWHEWIRAFEANNPNVEWAKGNIQKPSPSEWLSQYKHLYQ